MKRLLLFVMFYCTVLGLLQAQDTVLRETNGAVDTDQLNKEGIELSRQGRHDEALRKFKRAAGVQDSNAARTYNNMGYAYEMSSDKLKAIASYRAAIKRDPNLVLSLQNLGRLLYQGGQYNEAIVHGEKVLSLDPRNQEVPTWLPDAYQKQTEQRMFRLDQQRQGEPTERKKPADYYVLHAGYEFTGALRYNKSNGVFALNRQAGLVQYPMNLFAEFRPSPEFTIDLYFGTPDLGSIHPGFMAGRQKAEFTYATQKIFFGLGLLFTQANMSFDMVSKSSGNVTFRQNTDISSIDDTKWGLIFGMKPGPGRFKLGIYPRYLIRDGSSGPQGIAIDAAQIEMVYEANPVYLGSRQGTNTFPLTFKFRAFFDEIYITEYKIPSDSSTIGHYFGTYDFSFSVELFELKKSLKKMPFTIGFMLTERLYFQDLSNSSPFDFGNGQGYFGFSTSGSFSGQSFPGFVANSHIMSVFSRQLLFNMLYLKERIGYEFSTSASPFNSLFFDISLAVRF